MLRLVDVVRFEGGPHDGRERIMDDPPPPEVLVPLPAPIPEFIPMDAPALSLDPMRVGVYARRHYRLSRTYVRCSEYWVYVWKGER